MQITIHCTPDQAIGIRDALHNYFYQAIVLKSERAQLLANACKDTADQLSRRLIIADKHSHIQIFLEP